MKRFPIVLLHGWGSEGKFSLLIDRFKKNGYTVYAPEFSGFGNTQMPERPLFLSDYATYLRNYLSVHKIEKPILVGHSFGGRVAIRYEEIYPNSTSAVILTGTPGFSPVRRTKYIVSLIIAKIGNAILSIPPFFLMKDTIRKFYYYVVGARDYYRAKGVMRQTFKNIVQEDLVRSMRSLRVPCALIWGENDAIVPVWVAKKMRDVIPHCQLYIIPESDHGVPYKNPELFVNKMEEFLQTV